MKRQIAFFSVIAVSLALLAGGCTAVLSMHSSSFTIAPFILLAIVLIGVVVFLLFMKRFYTTISQHCRSRAAGIAQAIPTTGFVAQCIR